MLSGRVSATTGAWHPGEPGGKAPVELEPEAPEERAVVLREGACVAPVSDQRDAATLPSLHRVGSAGVQEGPFPLYVDQEGLRKLGQGEEASARVISPSPDCCHPCVGFVNVDPGLGIDVDMEASKREAR